MKPAKTASVEELQITSQFVSVRKVLLAPEYDKHLDKPLAYWALPTDRRLPLAFLGRTLRELLNTPFATLSATPGIGQKKIASFVKLLGRAANTDPAQLPADVAPPPEPVVTAAALADDGDDFAMISEVVWDQWRASVVRHGLGGERLGRFAPSLQNMTPRHLEPPLGDYTHHAGQIRELKTHGEKRVRARCSKSFAASMRSSPAWARRITSSCGSCRG